MLSKQRKIFNGLAIVLAILSLAGALAVLAVDNEQATTSQENGILPEKDLIEALCLNSQWRSADFLAWISAYGEFKKIFPEKIFPTGEKDVFPGPEQFQKESAAKLSEICVSDSYTAALDSFRSLADIEILAQTKLREADAFLQKYFQDRADVLKAKISAADKANLKSFIAREKAKKENELKSMAGQMAGLIEQNLKTDLSAKKFPNAEEAQRYVAFIVEQQQNDLNNQLRGVANQMKTELQRQADLMVLSFVGKDGGLALIIKEVQQVRSDIANLYQDKAKDSEKLKGQALEKRKNLVLALLDKELTIFKNQNLSEGQEAIQQLSKVRKVFLDETRAVILAGDVDGLNKAVKEAQNGWQKARLIMPEAALSGKDLERICSSTPVFIATVKPQLEDLARKIQNIGDAEAKRAASCQANQTRKGCAAFNAVVSHLAILQSDVQSFSNALALLENQCKNQNNSNDILKIIDNAQKSGLKLQRDWANWKARWPQYQRAI